MSAAEAAESEAEADVAEAEAAGFVHLGILDCHEKRLTANIRYMGHFVDPGTPDSRTLEHRHRMNYAYYCSLSLFSWAFRFPFWPP